MSRKLPISVIRRETEKGLHFDSEIPKISAPNNKKPGLSLRAKWKLCSNAAAGLTYRERREKKFSSFQLCQAPLLKLNSLELECLMWPQNSLNFLDERKWKISEVSVLRKNTWSGWKKVKMSGGKRVSTACNKWRACKKKINLTFVRFPLCVEGDNLMIYGQVFYPVLWMCVCSWQVWEDHVRNIFSSNFNARLQNWTPDS